MKKFQSYEAVRNRKEIGAESFLVCNYTKTNYDSFHEVMQLKLAIVYCYICVIRLCSNLTKTYVYMRRKRSRLINGHVRKN